MRRLHQALSLAILPTATYVWGALLNILGFSLNAGGLLIGILATIAILWRTRCGWRLPLLFIAIATLWGSIKLADAEWDGKAIHKPAAILLAKGWNPITEPVPNTTDAAWTWSEYYPKASWYVNAQLLRATGNVDLGDGVPILWAGVLFCLALAVFPTLYSTSPGTTKLLSLLLILHPIALRELACGYIDGQLYYTLMTGLFAFVAYARKPCRELLILAGICCLYGANLKFTAIVYFGISYALIGAVTLYRHFAPRRLIALATIALATLLCGTSPYVTNSLRHSSPFYPLHSFDANHPSQSDAVLHQWLTPEGVQTNRFKLAFKSLLALTPRDKNLFAREDLTMYPQRFLQLALWGSLLLLGIKRRLDLLTLTLLITILIQPGLWHFRYIPQLWALPILLTAQLPKARFPMATLLFLSLLIPIKDLGYQTWLTVSRTHQLGNVLDGKPRLWYCNTNAPLHTHEYDYYWLQWLTSAGIPLIERRETPPNDREEEYGCLDLRLYPDPPAQTTRRSNRVVAIFRLRARQLAWAWTH